MVFLVVPQNRGVSTGGVGPQEKIMLQWRNWNHLWIIFVFFFMVSIWMAIKSLDTLILFNWACNLFCRRKRRIRPGFLDAYPWLSWKGRGPCFPIHKHNKHITNMIKSTETYRNQILGRLNIGHYPRESFAKVGQSKQERNPAREKKGAVSLNPYDKVCFRGS